MLRSCLLTLLLYGAIAVGYYFWLVTVFDPPEVYWASGVLGFVVFCCLGALLNARTAWRDWSLAAAARVNEPLRDGRLMVAAGPIQPVGEPLRAPFSNAACCLCEYELSQEPDLPSRDDAKKGADLAGFLMTPSEVHTRSGKVKVLGFPVLEEEKQFTLASFTAARRARDFVTRTQFEDISGLRLLNVFGAIQDAWTDDDGRVEKNLQLKKVDPQKLFPDDLEAAWQEINGESPDTDEEEELEDDELEEADEDDDEADADDDLNDDSASLSGLRLPTLKENRVDPGDQVCIIGKYDEMHGGIRPTGGGMQALRLIRGDIETLEKKSSSSLWSHLIGGILFLVIAHAVTYGAMMLYLYSDSQIRKHGQEAFKAVEKGDIKKLARLQQQKVDLDALRDSDERTLLMMAHDPQTASWLLAQKVNVNAVDKHGDSAVSHAVRGNKPEIVKQLIAAGADLKLRNRSQVLPLDVAHQSGYEEVAKTLRAAGALDDVITAKNGEPLPEDGGPQLVAIKDYQKAIRDRDAKKLAALMTEELQQNITADMWTNFNFGIVREVQDFEGFTKDDAATVEVRGTWGETEDGKAKAVYQLRRVDGQWKVLRQRIDIN